MYLYKIVIVTYFFLEILRSEIGQCHNNYSSEHFQVHFLRKRKVVKLFE